MTSPTVQRSMSSILGTILVASLIVLVPTDGASASGGNYGWTQCNWSWREEAPDANIYFRDDGTFPGDVVRDGVLNSFHGRMTDALAEWNLRLAALGLRTRLVRVSSGALLFAHYQQVGGGAAGGHNPYHRPAHIGLHDS